MIAAETIRAELTAIEKASYNAARAQGMMHVADSALSEVGNLLDTIRGNVVAAAGGGLSEAEMAAKQLEIDAALEAINRIGNTTSFGGQKLLDGSTMTFCKSRGLAPTPWVVRVTIASSPVPSGPGSLPRVITPKVTFPASLSMVEPTGKTVRPVLPRKSPRVMSSTVTVVVI